jgi:hypothetical protein
MPQQQLTEIGSGKVLYGDIGNVKIYVYLCSSATTHQVSTLVHKGCIQAQQLLRKRRGSTTRVPADAMCHVWLSPNTSLGQQTLSIQCCRCNALPYGSMHNMQLIVLRRVAMDCVQHSAVCPVTCAVKLSQGTAAT